MSVQNTYLGHPIWVMFADICAGNRPHPAPGVILKTGQSCMIFNCSTLINEVGCGRALAMQRLIEPQSLYEEKNRMFQSFQ